MTTREFIFSESYSSQLIYIECTGIVTISSILADSGAGYKNISPLIVKVDGLSVAASFTVVAGVHTIELLGAPFVGGAMKLLGDNLEAIVYCIPQGESVQSGRLVSTDMLGNLAYKNLAELNFMPADGLDGGAAGTNYEFQIDGGTA